MHPQLTLYKEAAASVINTAFEIEKLDDGCAFSEGPVWNPEGFYLYSDIPANAIYKIVPGQKKEVYIKPSGCTHQSIELLSDQIGSNGLAYDKNGALFICQHGNGAVAKATGHQAEVFLSSPCDKPFNSPNDIVVHSNGTIYFSDPPYGLKDAKLNPAIRQSTTPFYAWRNGKLNAFCTQYQFPNGLCISPDGSSLYICSNKPFERFILEYDTITLERKRVVAAENGDGIKCDQHGNLYLCTKEGVLIIDENGERLAKIGLETIPANCCWGGAFGNDLFITARQNLFLIRNLQKR
ncbi:MAG: hypothetical protein JWP88_1867 [Flaviaesturariibacter sp.]|nr:hypothetical protein [Flaviaesturariibacter sp.]